MKKSLISTRTTIRQTPTMTTSEGLLQHFASDSMRRKPTSVPACGGIEFLLRKLGQVTQQAVTTAIA